MLIHTRKLLLSLVLGGACATTASAQELLLLGAGTQNQVPPPIGGVQESIPSDPIPYESIPSAAYPSEIIAQEAPTTTILTPVPDDGTGIIRVSDCPQNGDGAAERKKHLPPTTGWVPPGQISMHRMWVPYHKFYPNAWMGQPAGPQARLPVIYTPTDTTQLGYYYQHVPHWHTYANMLPPVPRPVDWHYLYHSPRSARNVRRVAPMEDLGQPQPIPTPSDEQPAPAPPSQPSLDKSANIPELLPLME
jgi:hypothetical protein